MKILGPDSKTVKVVKLTIRSLAIGSFAFQLVAFILLSNVEITLMEVLRQIAWAVVLSEVIAIIIFGSILSFIVNTLWCFFVEDKNHSLLERVDLAMQSQGRHCWF
jgi:hypothetical protein